MEKFREPRASITFSARKGSALKKMFRMVRFTLFCFFLSLIQVMALDSYSQQTRISLNQHDQRLEEVLKTIEDKSEFFFLYNKDLINVDQTVNISASNQTIKVILDELLKGTDISYSVVNRQIILSNLEGISGLHAQQQKSVSGKVTDSSGAPLPGVTVVVKGSTSGTITDTNGNFSISTVPTDAILAFSFIGLKTQEIAVGGKTILNVNMVEENIGIEEVVAVGYGTQRKGNLTGSISSVKSEKMTIAPVTNIANGIVGQLPGLIAKQTSGQPGADAANISIRGFGNALIIVDGVESRYNNIDANQIESVSILKDGAASIYGARAGNGVILITTKRGGNQKPTITLNSSYSLQGVTIMPRPTSAGQLAELQREIWLQGGSVGVAPWAEEQVQKFKDGSDPVNYPNTNWYDIVFRDWAPQQQHNISVRGGSDKIKYYGFIGYLDQETMIKIGGGGYNRYNAQSNIDAKITDDLTLRFDFSGAFEKRKFPIRGIDNNGPAWQDLYTTRPFYPSSYSDTTKLAYGGSDVGSVIGSTNMDLTGYTASDTKDMKGTLSLDYNIRWIKGLKAKAMVNYSEINTFEKRFSRKCDFYAYNPASQVYTYKMSYPSTTDLAQVQRFSSAILQQYSLNYENKFNDHRISAIAVYESTDYKSNFFSAKRINYTTTAIDQIFAGSTVNQTTDGSATEMGRKSFITRANYSYKDKYLIETILRADASAKFPSNSRWGYFPSVSLGWVVSQESFMKGFKALDNLKLRVSYGESGNDAVGNFQYLAGYNFGDLYAFNSVSQQGMVSKGIANPLLTWERMNIMNAGFDYSLFNRKLYGEIDVFYRNRTGIPGTRINSLPSTFGASLPQENLNSINDRGFEFSVGTSGKIGELTYDVSANISWSRARWGHYEEPVYIDPDQARISTKSGHWTDEVWGYKSAGLFTSQDQITKLPYDLDLKGNTTIKIGDLNIQDINGDKKIDWKDQVVVAKGTTPHWMMGSNIYLKYRNFDFSALLQGAFGYSTYCALRGVFGGIFSSRFYETRWTEATNDPNALTPRINGALYNRSQTDFYYKNSLYVRLKTVALGYTLPREWLRVAGIEQFRVFASGANVLTFNKLRTYEIDPEAAMDVNALKLYPQQRVISLGVNISF